MLYLPIKVKMLVLNQKEPETWARVLAENKVQFTNFYTPQLLTFRVKKNFNCYFLENSAKFQSFLKKIDEFSMISLYVF